MSMEELDRLARRPHSVVISCNMRLNLDEFHEKMWEYLNLIRVYTKKPGNTPDFSDGLILRKGKVIIIFLNSNMLTSTHLSLQLGSSIEHVCHTIHRSIADVFKYALIWVSSRNNLRRKKTTFHFISLIIKFIDSESMLRCLIQYSVFWSGSLNFMLINLINLYCIFSLKAPWNSFQNSMNHQLSCSFRFPFIRVWIINRIVRLSKKNFYF